MSISLRMSGPGTGLRFNADGASRGWNGPDAALKRQCPTATGISQGRLNEIINGHRQVARLDILERIAGGLAMPDDARVLFGLAPVHADTLTGHAEISGVFTVQAEANAELRDQAAVAARVDVLAVRALGIRAAEIGESPERIDRSGPPGLAPVCQEIADRQSPRLLPQHCDIGQAVAAQRHRRPQVRHDLPRDRGPPAAPSLSTT
jgi:hypothetical protein